MPRNDTDLASKPGRLIETFRFTQPRLVFMALVTAALLLVLVVGLAREQLTNAGSHDARERIQNQRRMIYPGPRGEILDRQGRVLVGNRQRLSVVLELDKLQSELWRQFLMVRTAYRNSGDTDLPPESKMRELARVKVAQRYLDQVNKILGRDDQVDRPALIRHFARELLVPYVLLDDLNENEFARLLSQLPVNSPIQLFKSSVRDYPYGSAAAHVLGAVKEDLDIDAEDFGDPDLTTFKMKGLVGRDGIEQRFDGKLQGEAGGAVYRVNPSGYPIQPAIRRELPRQGNSLTTSLDIDLQLTGEKEFAKSTGGDLAGAFVALDVNTGEVLAMASFPNYDLRDISPRMSSAKSEEIEAAGGWLNRATHGLYLPGSTFKLVVSVAGFRNGKLTPESTYETTNRIKIGDTIFRDAAGDQPGVYDYHSALEKSINTYFINFGMQIGSEAISAEAARLHLTQPTGFDLPETRGSYVGNDAWKRNRKLGPWVPGDTANISFGQGYMNVTPLQMACMVASLARGETYTQPTIIHDPAHPRQHTPPLDLTPAQYTALVEGMEAVVKTGTASRTINSLPEYRVPGLTVAGKTGTAQKEVKGGKLEIGWYVCFAPVENPEIAIAVVVEGDIPDEATQGGRFAAPAAHAMLKTWWEKQQRSGGLRPASQ